MYVYSRGNNHCVENNNEQRIVKKLNTKLRHNINIIVKIGSFCLIMINIANKNILPKNQNLIT